MKDVVNDINFVERYGDLIYIFINQVYVVSFDKVKLKFEFNFVSGLIK